MFWIHDKNSVGNTPMFYFLLSSLYMEVKVFFCFSCGPANKEAGSTQGGENTSRTADLKLTEGRPQTRLWSAIKAQGESLLGLPLVRWRQEVLLFISFFPSSPSSPNNLLNSLSQPRSCQNFFAWFPPHHGWSKQMAAWFSAASQG